VVAAQVAEAQVAVPAAPLPRMEAALSLQALGRLGSREGSTAVEACLGVNRGAAPVAAPEVSQLGSSSPAVGLAAAFHPSRNPGKALDPLAALEAH